MSKSDGGCDKSQQQYEHHFLQERHIRNNPISVWRNKSMRCSCLSGALDITDGVCPMLNFADWVPGNKIADWIVIICYNAYVRDVNSSRKTCYTHSNWKHALWNLGENRWIYSSIIKVDP
jgi:hypothetical protein